MSFLEVVLRKLNRIGLKMVRCWSIWIILLPCCLCASPVLILLTLIPLSWDTYFKKSFRLDEKRFLWLSFYFFGPWTDFFDLCRTLHALNATPLCICASCIYLYALCLLILLYCFCFEWIKIQKLIKSKKISKNLIAYVVSYHILSLVWYLYTNGIVYLRA